MEVSINTNRNVAYCWERAVIAKQAIIWVLPPPPLLLLSILCPHLGVISMSVLASAQSFKYDKQPHSHLLNRLKGYALFKPTRLSVSQTESAQPKSSLDRPIRNVLRQR